MKGGSLFPPPKVDEGWLAGGNGGCPKGSTFLSRFPLRSLPLFSPTSNFLIKRLGYRRLVSGSLGDLRFMGIGAPQGRLGR